MLRDLFSLFPAYAGVIPSTPAGLNVKKTFPRICGGDPDPPLVRVTVVGFSPHMRG